MSITSFIKKVCVQTAVYWGSPVNDGYGGQTYAAPREIKCRWEDKPRTLRYNDGQEIITKAEVLVVEDLELHGWLYLGYIMDLEDPNNNFEVPENPKDITGAFEIIAFDKDPLFRSTSKFVKTIFLGFFNVK